MMTDIVLYTAALAAVSFFVFVRSRRYLHFYQQDEYDTARFGPWLGRTRAFDKKLSIALLVFLIMMMAVSIPLEWQWALGGAMMGVWVLREPNPLKAGKKPLVMTVRAREILYTSVVLGGAIMAVCLVIPVPLLLIVFVQMPPFLLMAATLILSPHEKARQAFYRREAEGRLAAINPRIIGITGSFGKTTTKHLLGHMLTMLDQAYITPGSTNTVMGNVRLIREKLPADCRNFVVEMGAYGPGSIGRLCGLTPPHHAIITAIGEAHYERFKSLDAVARTKFELAEAVLKTHDGMIVIHDSVLDQPYAQEVVSQNRDRFIICGTGESCDWMIMRVDQNAQGVIVTLRHRSDPQDVTLTAPLFGSYAASNMVLSFALGRALGYDTDRLVQAFRSAPQTRHRLEVIRHDDGTIIIDDAYNSNPRGFRSALEILSLLGENGSKPRILVTPGMVELGERHETLHAELGREAARHVDILLVVRPERIPSFVDCFRTAAPDRTILEMDSFAQAQAWLDANKPAGSVVLLENDLPDLYERRLDL